MRRTESLVAVPAVLLALGLLAGVQQAAACPFCSAVSLTFDQEIQGSDIALFARLIEPPVKSDFGDGLPEFNLAPSKAKFEITQVLKGAEHLGNTRTFEATYFGDSPVGTEFLVMGIEPPAIVWSSPIQINDRVRKYIVDMLALPERGPERLAFFQQYLEDSDEMLARDAYDEFATTPYEEVKALKPYIDRERLWKWIDDPQVNANRRRLYFTMLGVCGQPEDADRLEAMLKSSDRQQKSGLDALIACYLTLKGPEGVPLIENLYPKNLDAEYVDTYAAIMALRFHGQEGDRIPTARVVAALRHMLDRPQLADLVIPDLARWQDWSVVDQLVELFKTADQESSWVRVPVVNYLRACPLPEAKQRLKELEQIDPDSVRRASSFFPLGAPAGTPGGPAADAKPADEDSGALTPNAGPAALPGAGIADVVGGAQPALVPAAKPAEATSARPAATLPPVRDSGQSKTKADPAGRKTAVPAADSLAASPPAAAGNTWRLVLTLIAVAALGGFLWVYARGTRSRLPA
jgi:hypothetical protein